MKKISLFDMPDDDERGVSPVIGVILMVAITVMLAAVIATFVLGFPDQVSQNVNAGADISENSQGNATVTWISEGNAVNLSVSAKGAELEPTAGNISSVGGTVNVYQTSNPTKTVNVVVTAYGESGTQTVVAQKEVTLENASA